MTKKDAEIYFKEICPTYKTMDKGQKNVHWAFFTDALCKNNEITQKQYDTWLLPRFLK